MVDILDIDMSFGDDMKSLQRKPANIEVNDEEEEDDINCDI